MTQKYKLINTTTKEETICDKIQIENFDYYYIDERPKMLEWFFDKLDLVSSVPIYKRNNKQKSYEGCYKIIACNNPNIDILKVVDEVEVLALNEVQNISKKQFLSLGILANIGDGIMIGYNKSQETHPFTEEDVREIFKIAQMQKNYGDYKPYTFEEAINIWKEQQTKIVYYE